MLISAGCAGAMRSYNSELRETTQLLAASRPDLAVQVLEQNNTSEQKDLLYFLEKGTLLRLQGEFAGSRDQWLEADRRVREWEDLARSNPSKLLGDIGSLLVNDKVRPYEGYDYEKVLLTALLAMDHMALGEWDVARTEIKKTHEREAIIAEFHAKKVMQEETEAKKRQVTRTVKDLQGYPVDTLNDPQVIALKNGYQNAFSHYLAGFVYEALNEPSLAAPGYRQAIELRPDIAFLQEGLKQLDQRKERTAAGKSDVLFVLEGGLAPARSSLMIPLPVPAVGLVSISFPVIPNNPTADYRLSSLMVEDTSIPMATVTHVDAMARRTLADDMPGIILRSTLRAVTRGVAQHQTNKKGNELASLAIMLGGLVMESADERSWRTLPATIQLGRAALKPGKYTMRFPAANGMPVSVPVEISGRYQIVPIRVVGNTLYVANTPGSAHGTLPVAAGQEEKREGSAPTKVKSNKKKSKEPIASQKPKEE
ncbi:COG3014 family protein [Candidatus Magnetaquicoccus inordinatus]|uniref:COG3014 family protein n=1 Tax=Candidatus Magnetaquicoccus inordinatus TaxID=2496818 RepID=UPI00102CEB73|nr:hypothetical protein [Candidatus Magnetaquicoccus inordinatus]